MDPIAVTAALLRNQLPDVTIREGASLMARVASKGEGHAVIVIAGIPVTAKLPPEVQAGATLKLKVQEVTPERVTLQIEPQQPAAAPASAGDAGIPRSGDRHVRPGDATAGSQGGGRGTTGTPPRSRRRARGRRRAGVHIAHAGSLDLRLELRGERLLHGVTTPRAARTPSPTRALSVYAPHWKRPGWRPR